MLYSNTLPFFPNNSFYNDTVIVIDIDLDSRLLGSKKTSCFAKPNSHQSDGIAKKSVIKQVSCSLCLSLVKQAHNPAPNSRYWLSHSWLLKIY